MLPASRIQAAIDVLTLINDGWAAQSRQPADGVLHDYFSQRRYIGSKDRGAVSELVYFVLRHGGALDWVLEQQNTASSPRRLVIAALLAGFGKASHEVEALFNGERFAPIPMDAEEKALLKPLAAAALDDASMPHSARLNFPEWMLGRLRDRFGDALEPAMAALMQDAPIDLRANTLKASREDVILALDKEGIVASPTSLSPLGLRLKKRMPVFAGHAFRQGLFEMQDEGSQLVAACVAAKAGDKVIDFCAGAGGKTLALAARMENKGRILAWDVSAKRLEQMPKRLKRAGVHNVTTHVLESESDQFIKRHKRSADWVLVDAPCSGSGTWRRNPDLKWRFTINDLKEMVELQRRILASAERLVKPGGHLVYATCSLFADENEKQVEAFLQDYPDFAVATPSEIRHNLLTLQPSLGTVLQLSPHKEGCDGFFAAVLQRRA